MKSLRIMLCILLLSIAGAHAAAPLVVNFQGRLTDGSGVPVADGSYTVSFRLYDAPTGGTALWAETQSVTVSGGLFTVLLGAVSPFDDSLVSGVDRYLGIAVGLDPPLSPRTRLASVPYALTAATGGNWTESGGSLYPNSLGNFVGIGTATPVHALHVVEPTGGLFVSRFESASALATVAELTNTSVPATWEWAISGSSSAFGTVPPGAMYLYNQGSSDLGMVIEPDNKVSFGGPGGASSSKVYMNSAQSGINRTLEVLANGPDDNIAVYARVSAGVGGGYAIHAEAPTVSGFSGGRFVGSRGVVGNATEVAVEGFTTSATSFSCVGVSGDAMATGGQESYGVIGIAHGNGNNYGVYGDAIGGTATWAGWFDGNTHVNGTLSKSAGSFRIDHPLDPANRYLQHSFVESPDMMNVYNGNILLDAKGEATVRLPEYFGALNKDFRYQLTCIGGYAPVYVAEKVSGNRFRIAGGTPGLEVSWQITGVRNDAYAQEHRLEVDLAKGPGERGKYLHPDLFGADASRSIVVAPPRASVDARDDSK